MNSAFIGLIVGIIAVIFAIVIVLYATGIIKKGFQRSEPKPGAKFLSKTELKKMLLKLNNKKNPFSVKSSEDTDLFIEWKILNAKWIEMLGKAWAKKTYSAWVLLDEKDKTVRYNERIKEAGFTAGAAGVSGEVSSFRGIELWRKERGYRYGIKEDFSIGEVYNYKFNPSDIKDVIRQIANDHGWAFELVISKRQASR
ncbi:hypothetical protein J4457_06515 [Candidatus Woesearchaeota archaeon]|nr:hypothetical protein [Candidatus Woesearchaeota archaeon]